MRLRHLIYAAASLASLVGALGQKPVIAVGSDVPDDALRLAGEDFGAGQILVSDDDYWGVIRAAGDLAVDFGRVTGTNYTLSNGQKGAGPAEFKFDPVDVSNNTHYLTTAEQSFKGPEYSDPDASKTVIIAGTIGNSTYIDDLISSGELDVSEIEGKWEAFMTKLVRNPIPGCEAALVIAGSMPRGTIYGIYDVSEQIGVSPWHFWADVPSKSNKDLFALPGQKTQGAPSVKYRGLFVNDEQPGLTNWVATNWPGSWNGDAGFNHEFYALVSELILRLRANYLWPAVWGTIFYTDDPLNQPLVYAHEVVLGSSHTEPLMRAQNEFKKYYEGEWAYNLNNETIDEYFRYGVQRAKPYVRNSLFTMAMRGTGDTAIEGLGVDAIIQLLETVVDNQQDIMKEVLDVDDLSGVSQMWCLYKEVQSYKQQGLAVSDDITLLWSDDNWGDVRRLPLKNETDRPSGAGVYYHFDYVGDPRDYKWINTIQLQKTAEQLQMAHARHADQIWIANVGDIKPLEIPISHFMDLAYDADAWPVGNTSSWVGAWVSREFGSDKMAENITSIITRYGMYAARRKFELVEPETYSILNYNEADAVLQQWTTLEKEAQAVYEQLDEAHKPPFFEMVLHPVTGGRILYEIQISAATNRMYAFQKRNSANAVLEHARELLADDANLTMRWDGILDGKWEHMMDQTHLGYDDYWQQPMRNTLPAMRYVQDTFTSLAGEVRVGVEGSQAAVPGDDRFHANSGNALAVPPLDPYGAATRYFDVFSTGVEACEWAAAPWEPWVKLSEYDGTVGPDEGDRRVLISVDWENAPAGPNETVVNINFTTPCRGFDRFNFKEAVIQVPVVTRSVPDNFTSGFVESDGYVAIEGPHYQTIETPKTAGNSTKQVEYHTFDNYGRTLGGVGIYPADTEKLSVEEAPALQYDMYLFSNYSTANVTLYLSPSQNYLGDWNPLEYAITLHPANATDAPPTPETVQFVGESVGSGMPPGWEQAVADATWGPRTNTSTTSFKVGAEGAYTLRVWCLLPSVVVQRVVVDLGGVRESYLGPPESFLVGRDERGLYDGTSVVGSVAGRKGEEGELDGQGDAGDESGSGSGSGKGSQSPTGAGGRVNGLGVWQLMMVVCGVVCVCL